MHPIPKKPIDELRSLGAPHDLVDWFRKLPPEDTVRRAWVDAPRPQWMPYLAVLRGLDRGAILRATCACAVETAERTLTGPEADRVLAVLRAAVERGKDALATAEADLGDLRHVMIDHEQAGAGAPAPWMVWAKLVLELARASGRGNPLVGISLAMKLLADAAPARGGQPARQELVARFRDKLVLG